MRATSHSMCGYSIGTELKNPGYNDMHINGVVESSNFNTLFQFYSPTVFLAFQEHSDLLLTASVFYSAPFSVVAVVLIKY